MKRNWRVGREWRLPPATFDGDVTIDDEEGHPIADEDDVHLILSEES